MDHMVDCRGRHPPEATEFRKEHKTIGNVLVEEAMVERLGSAYPAVGRALMEGLIGQAGCARAFSGVAVAIEIFDEWKRFCAKRARDRQSFLVEHVDHAA